MEKKKIMAALLGGALTMMSLVAFAEEPATTAVVEKAEPAATAVVEKTEPAEKAEAEKAEPAATAAVEKAEPAEKAETEKAEPATTAAVEKAEPAEKAETEKVEPAVPAEWKEATVRAAITGYEAGTIYKLTDAEGNVIRADLGKHGGKMLNRIPFTATGTMETDEKGEYLKVKHIEYMDPAAAIQVNRSNPLSRQMQTRLGKKSSGERDAAYFHKGIDSTNANYYENQVTGAKERDAYAPVSLLDLDTLKAGTRVQVKASALESVVPEQVVNFWDRKAKAKVQMNGAYAPLGQRCTVYGTVQKAEDGSSYIYLERLESVAEDGWTGKTEK